MRTPLHDRHVELGGKMVEFSGWDMPLHYGSQVKEHHEVRSTAGMFDVSHMLPIDLAGPASTQLLQRLLVGDVSKLDESGQALYSVMLNGEGGIIDDLIVYRRSADEYRMIVNAGSADTDLNWITSHVDEMKSDVVMTPRRDLSIIAIQGPDAISITAKMLDSPQLKDLRPFFSMQLDEYFISRTGYTGEDGFEVLCYNGDVHDLWNNLLDANVTPCGLGARDTLRLEAGLNLNGNDMDPTTSPLECNLKWVIDWEPENRQFIGREPLTAHLQRGVETKLTGIVLSGGVMRHGYTVHTSSGDGVITSGTFSPTLGYSVALARVPRDAKGTCNVDIRNRSKEGRLVRPPFVKHGKKVHK